MDATAAITTGLTEAASQMTGIIGVAIPIVMGIVGTIIAVRFGIRFFRGNVGG